MRNLKQGETVNLIWDQGVTSSTPFQISTVDCNFNARPLQPYERLVIDSLDATTSLINSISHSATALTAVFVFGSTTANAGPFSVVTFQPAGPHWVEFPGEGLALPIGAVLMGSVTDSNVAPSTGALFVLGVGRIVDARTQGIRPAWRESMSRGD